MLSAFAPNVDLRAFQHSMQKGEYFAVSHPKYLVIATNKNI
jgi:hypothetical protein